MEKVRQRSLLPEDPASDPPLDDAPSAAQSARLDGQTVYAVDAHALIYQVFHALPDMTSPQGEPVGAVFGFLRDIFDLIEKRRPDRLLCAFDAPGPNFRQELFPEYKANREAMPGELATQIPKIRELLDALGVPCLALPGYEADDLLATLARLCEQAGGQCMLVTSDKDYRQLITDQIQLYDLRKDEVFDARKLRETWGIRPDQAVDFQALVGDRIDNIPGVPLIGPKLAQQLLEDYDTLDEVLARAEDVKGTKRRENLLRYADQARLSRRLAALNCEVPLQPDWHAAQIGPVDSDRVSQLFSQLGFRALGQRAAALSGAKSATKPATWPTECHVIDSSDALASLIESLAQQTQIALATQTTCLAPRWAELVGITLAWQPGEAFYLPLRGPTALDPRPTLEALKPLLEDPNIAKTGHDLKFARVVLRCAGISLRGLAFDTMVASYLLDAGQRNHSLSELSRRYLNHTPKQLDELLGKGRDRKQIETLPIRDVARCVEEEVGLPLRLRPILQERLDQFELDKLNRTVEVPLVEVLADIEFTGIRVDTQRLSALSVEYGNRIGRLEKEIEDLAGHALNIASPKQLAKVLFGELGLPVVKKTKTGPSTDASVLEELATAHPLPAKILEYRKFAKLKATYVDALPQQVQPETGRIHATFHQTVAATGRLSSSDPNLQNIPVRTEEGREIRSAFTPGQPGWKLLSADYSQIELRVLAHFCGDRALCEAFARDEDVHSLVASQVYGVALTDVTSDMRRSAKAVNFGVIYGQSAFGLARSLGISREKAAEFIEAYFARYQGVERFLEETLARCRSTGYVTTILGRRRTILGVRHFDTSAAEPGRNPLRQLNLPERTAVNTVIQGSAADLIKLAMLEVQRRLATATMTARLLLQIHDELVFETPVEELDRLSEVVVEAMTGVLSLTVPLKVDVKVGDNWSDCEPLG